MTELNPCPSCGCEPDIFEYGENHSHIYCTECSDITEAISRSASGAMNAWNAATSGEYVEPAEKTLRDEFAMAVLNGAIAANANHRPVSYDDLAADCYGVADAMIKERNK